MRKVSGERRLWGYFVTSEIAAHDGPREAGSTLPSEPKTEPATATRGSALTRNRRRTDARKVQHRVRRTRHTPE